MKIISVLLKIGKKLVRVAQLRLILRKTDTGIFSQYYSILANLTVWCSYILNENQNDKCVPQSEQGNDVFRNLLLYFFHYSFISFGFYSFISFGFMSICYLFTDFRVPAFIRSVIQCRTRSDTNYGMPKYRDYPIQMI